MMHDIPSQGAADEVLRRQAHRWWADEAAKSGIDLTGFDADAPLEQRLSWALALGLPIGTVYARFSSKMQHSTADQVRVDVKWAARNEIYTPPEFVCVDEGVKGSKVRRDGLDRMRALLKSRRAGVLLVYKASRLFRHAYRGFQLIQEDVVEQGLRAVSVSQGIDTADEKMWKAQLSLHGIMDNLLLDAIADHCREGLNGLFLGGFVTGALTVGYRPVEVPGAPTNKGRPRTRPAIDEGVAAMIREHFELVRDGMSLSEGLRLWRRAGGPSDRRSTTGKMSYQAYRRMLGNVRYTGLWHFGKKRNKWSSGKDYTRQEAVPESEVKAFRCEELRIVGDDLFLAVQARLQCQETGPRPPRQGKARHLWDLVTGAFRCSHCKRRFHVCGAHGHAMRCPSPDCTQPVMVDRKEAVLAVSARLSEMILSDDDLTLRIVAATRRADAAADDGSALSEMERKARLLTNRICDLTELVGEGSDEDRAELKKRIKAAQAERAGVQLEISRRKQASSDRRPLTEQEVRTGLDDLGEVLRAAGSGELGTEAVHKAADVFRRLVGGEVLVHAEARLGRKRATVVGRFRPSVLNVVAEACGAAGVIDADAAHTVDVWLRPPPRLDGVAPEVRCLYEDEGLGFRAIAKRLKIGCGNVYASYCRYYEMRGLPVPSRRPRGRQRRKA